MEEKSSTVVKRKVAGGESARGFKSRIVGCGECMRETRQCRQVGVAWMDGMYHFKVNATLMGEIGRSGVERR
jgi:hypothetical protein